MFFNLFKIPFCFLLEPSPLLNTQPKGEYLLFLQDLVYIPSLDLLNIPTYSIHLNSRQKSLHYFCTNHNQLDFFLILLSKILICSLIVIFYKDSLKFLINFLLVDCAVSIVKKLKGSFVQSL